jgi:hypothetical protein
MSLEPQARFLHSLGLIQGLLSNDVVRGSLFASDVSSEDIDNLMKACDTVLVKIWSKDERRVFVNEQR